MAAPIRSLHHVTATVDDAQADLDFYAGLLGMRLVKRTVNFDNPGVYHFYYGDRTGTPGTIMTTFPYKGMGVPAGRHGAGQITAIAFAVPVGSLDGWRRRLAGHSRTAVESGTRFGEEFLGLFDPSGLRIRLMASDDGDRDPWTTTGIDASLAIRGIHSLELSIAAPDRTLTLLTDLLGFRAGATAGDRTRMEVGEGGAGASLEILAAPEAPVAMNGLGTVHHLALAVDTAEDQLAYREEILRRGMHVTEVLDRQYFQSIYFREPGGVLFELATRLPGFGIDESPESLGQALKLPPWEEHRRGRIEAVLPEVTLPADRP